MQLDRMLDRCRCLEERAAAIYRAYAASSRTEPPLCALWTSLAREEEEHARAVAHARARRDPVAGWRTRLDGWEEALDEVEERIGAAEQLGPAATTAMQLSAALELELSEIESMRHALLEAAGQPDALAAPDHALHLAEAAVRLSDDPQVRLQAALLRARQRLEDARRSLRPTG